MNAKGEKMLHSFMETRKLSEREEFLAKQIVDAAFIVHKNLGPGLFERVYEVCFLICELKAVDQVNPVCRPR